MDALSLWRLERELLVPTKNTMGILALTHSWVEDEPRPRFKMLRRLCNKHTNWLIPQVIAWVWLITLYEVLHKLHTIKIRVGIITFINGETSEKMSQKLTLNQRMFWILGEINGLNSKLRHRKAQMSKLIWRFGDTYERPGDLCYI